VSTRNLTEAVRMLLLTDWDPIGIRDVPQAQDEYDEYAPGIAELLRSGCDADRIAAYLLQIETKAMRLSPDPARAQRAALNLMSLVA
jgi:hypothetical protein